MMQMYQMNGQNVDNQQEEFEEDSVSDSQFHDSRVVKAVRGLKR